MSFRNVLYSFSCSLETLFTTGHLLLCPFNFLPQPLNLTACGIFVILLCNIGLHELAKGLVPAVCRIDNLKICCTCGSCQVNEIKEIIIWNVQQSFFYSRIIKSPILPSVLATQIIIISAKPSRTQLKRENTLMSFMRVSGIKHLIFLSYLYSCESLRSASLSVPQILLFQIQCL